MTHRLSPAKRFVFIRIFPLPFLIGGAVTLYLGVRNVHLARESSSWSTVRGTVRQSSVEYRSSSDGPGTFGAAVEYEFTVDGTTFTGDRVAFGDYASSDSSHARSIVDEYPVEKSVTVYYQPDNPDVSVLEPGFEAQAVFMPAFGLVFFVVGAAMAFFLPKAVREKQPSEGGDTGEDGTVAT